MVGYASVESAKAALERKLSELSVIKSKINQNISLDSLKKYIRIQG